MTLERGCEVGREIDHPFLIVFVVLMRPRLHARSTQTLHSVEITGL